MLVLTEDSQPCIASVNGLSGKTTLVVERLFLHLRARPSLDQCSLLQHHHIRWEPLLGSSSLNMLLESRICACEKWLRSSKLKGSIRCDEQYRYQVDVGYVTARQQALELAMAVDEDCMELGIDRSPKGVAS